MGAAPSCACHCCSEKEDDGDKTLTLKPAWGTSKPSYAFSDPLNEEVVLGEIRTTKESQLAMPSQEKRPEDKVNRLEIEEARREQDRKNRELRAKQKAELIEARAQKRRDADLKMTLKPVNGWWTVEEHVIQLPVKKKSSNAPKVRIMMDMGEIQDGVFNWAPRFDVANPEPVDVRGNGTVAMTSNGMELLGTIVGDPEQPLFHKLHFNDGQVWERKGPSLGEYDGTWFQEEAQHAALGRNMLAPGEFLEDEDFDCSPAEVAVIEEGYLTWAPSLQLERGNQPIMLEQQQSGTVSIKFGERAHWLLKGESRWAILDIADEGDSDALMLWSNGEKWIRRSDNTTSSRGSTPRKMYDSPQKSSPRDAPGDSLRGGTDGTPKKASADQMVFSPGTSPRNSPGTSPRVSPRGRVHCPRNHKVTPFKIPFKQNGKSLWICRGCQRKSVREQKMQHFWCAFCNYSMCEQCYSRMEQLAKLQKPSSPGR
eukprot:gnl/MRDRNA2_/MRDRNA2_105799_c0_seq1.p1 gnl/MRDRNA2_/MRDRNA2_105799_c0~~gnl/MRDRNA2_/MRDRNA2_105799_c0_seq1.p1  ORF type:complete len:507 (-),score=97.15 gnl/MRDRNA2_/MRDRNA2_105799_c0_seq1:123-1568(-)